MTRLLKEGQSFSMGITQSHGGICFEQKTILKIKDKPEKPEDIDVLTRQLFTEFLPTGTEHVAIVDGANLLDRPDLRGKIDPNKVYVLEW